MGFFSWIGGKHDELHESQPEVVRSFLDHCRLEEKRVTVGVQDKVWENCTILWLSPGRQRVLIKSAGKVAFVNYDWVEAES